MHPARRGQTLIIFALTLTVLIGILGLAIDSVRVFDLYARAHRAAEAAALAGVIYLPNNYNTPLTGTPNNDSAVSRASREVLKNGLGTNVLSNNDTNVNDYCPANVQTIEIAVCRVTGKPYDLAVTLTEQTNVVLLGALGVGPVTISATASAEYIPPLAIGLDEGSTGSLFGNTDPGKNTTMYNPNINGPAELKEQGDPYVYCEEGPSDGPLSSTYGTGSSADSTNQSAYTTYDDTPTNHPQYNTYNSSTPQSAYNSVIANDCGIPSSSHQGNPDQLPANLAGEATKNSTQHPGAYNYIVTATAPNASLWIWNPNYVPSPMSSCNGRIDEPDTFFFTDCSSGNKFTYYPYYGSRKFNGYFDHPDFYFYTTISLYQVNNPNFPLNDTLVASNTFTPYDGMGDGHGCTYFDVVNNARLSSYNNGGVPQNNGSGCETGAAVQCVRTWCLIGNLTQGVAYRVAVEATGANASAPFTTGWGQHSYQLEVCSFTATVSRWNPQSGTDGCPTGGGAISALDNMDLLFQFPGQNTQSCVPMAAIPASYAGRTIEFDVFDPGDGPSFNDTSYMQLMPPTNGGPCSGTSLYPSISINYGNATSSTSWVRTSTAPGNGTWAYVANNGDYIYNGLWIRTTVQLPTNYNPTNLAQSLWYLNVQTASGKYNDTVGFRVHLIDGSPVHIVS